MIKIHRTLLAWYQKNKRNLPWRRTRDPYAVWISEIMLQQTQVATVIPYYEKFLKRFPNVRALAGGQEAAVLKSWAGLGYYSRARNLRMAAQEIMKNGGCFPSDFESILQLPGIGRYTAGAIASIALNQPYPVLDGNVARVFSRLFLIKKNVKKPKTQKKLWALAHQLLNEEHPGDWNQALMELGATVCLPDNPACLRCPLKNSCAAFKKGFQNRLPNTGRKPKPVPLEWQAALVCRNGSILISRRPDLSLLKNLWGLPSPEQIRAAKMEFSGKVSHAVTHHKITLKIFKALDAKVKTDKNSRWISRQNAPDYLVSSLWRKALKLKSRS